MKILNLTQHTATAEQVEAGVQDMLAASLSGLKDALTFDAAPSAAEITERAEYIAELAAMYDLSQSDDDGGCEQYPTAAMIGGALWLMAPLARELRARGITPMFAFTRREVVESHGPDGAVTKTAVFRHTGFVEAIM